VNAITPSLKPALPLELFNEAIARVNEWRGRCLDGFARAEMAVAECLAAMSEAGDKAPRVGPPQLVGQRYEVLAAAIAAGGPFAAQAGGVASVLERFRAHHDLRNMLAHGVGRVTLDRSGRWTVVLKVMTSRGGRACHDAMALTEREAEEIGTEVGRLSQVLCSQLGQLRSRIGR